MADTETSLKQQLEQLRKTATDDSIKKTAGFALAVLEMNPTAKKLDDLGVNLSNFDLKTGSNSLGLKQIQEAIKKWLEAGVIEKGIFNLQSDTPKPDPNLLNQLALTISACVKGELSKDVCNDTLTKFVVNEEITKQMVNLKLAVTTLKSLGFKIYHEDNVLVAGNSKKPVIQSVEEWREQNKANLPEKLSSSLIKVLKTLVLTANAYADRWESDKLVPAKFAERETPKKDEQSQSTIVLGIQSQMDALTGFQKYYSGLLPLKAQKLGLLNLEGGAGLYDYNKENKTGYYLSYVDEEVNSNKNFVTADVLEKFFNKYMEILKNKNINITDLNEEDIKKQFKELKEDEMTLINLTSIIEKYLALKKYFDVEDKAKTIKDITELLQKHKDKLKSVEKKRTGLGNILYVISQQIDMGF